jgi:hypothetical protein
MNDSNEWASEHLHAGDRLLSDMLPALHEQVAQTAAAAAAKTLAEVEDSINQWCAFVADTLALAQEASERYVTAGTPMARRLQACCGGCRTRQRTTLAASLLANVATS